MKVSACRALGLCLTTFALWGCGGSSSTPKPASPTAQTSDGVTYFAHELIVKRTDGVDAATFRKTISDIGGTILDDNGPMAALGYVRISLPEGLHVDDASVQLKALGAVDKAERNYVVTTSATPNDAAYSQLWGMTKINAPTAWNKTTGSANVLVVVSDTGIDYRHPDLAANVWTNPGEIPGNGIDDDHNGYVDDVHGYDFANNDGDPLDDNNHGSHCSGTIGGVGNNGVGVAGVNWTVKIAGAKFLASNGSGSLYAGAQSILYAAAIKARVVSASWGCGGASCYASYLEDSLRTLASAGGLFVAAAGNAASNNDTTPNYPSNYAVDNVVAVAAIDSNDALASFSNYGATMVHLAAPGVGIYSTVMNGGYASFSGTSMATPHVAGAAALYLSAHPTATYQEVRAQLLATVQPIAGLVGKVSTGGRLDVGKLIGSDTTPPAVPAGLKATPGIRNDMTVTWTASTDTDLAGYRLKWGTTSGQYAQSQDFDKLTTSLPLNLVHGTTYYFVLLALDTSGNWSAASPEVSAKAMDSTAPARVFDLGASTPLGLPASGGVSDSSGEMDDDWLAHYAADGNPDTSWLAPPRATAQEEYITVSLNQPYTIDRVELRPAAAFPQFFPVDFDIEISPDGLDWRPVGGQRSVSVAATDTVTVVFPATMASAVRLHVLRSYMHASGLFYTGVAELTARQANPTPGATRLTFTAPGDDPGNGKATSYDLRYSLSTILNDADFTAGTKVATGAPFTAGIPESVDVSGLAGEMTYNFAIKATDEAGNVALLSNIAKVVTGVIPPGTVTDLRALSTSDGAVTLAWTAPGGDGSMGSADHYELRWSTKPLDNGNFVSGTAVTGLPSPGPAGSAQQTIANGLPVNQMIYFGLRAVDGTGATGSLSNLLAVKATSALDHQAPAQVGGLVALRSQADVLVTPTVLGTSTAKQPASQLFDGNTATGWLSDDVHPIDPEFVTVDLGAAKPVVRFRFLPLQGDVAFFPQELRIDGSIDQTTWTTLVDLTGLSPGIGDWIDAGVPATPARYLKLVAVKRGPFGGNVRIAEWEIRTLPATFDAFVTFVAPGDDGYEGTATSYDLRRGTVPLTTTAAFNAASKITTTTPQRGGQVEVFPVGSLTLETTHHFAVTATDEAGNVSPLSNDAVFETPGIAPFAVTDLKADHATAFTAQLHFTASGDDGNVGTATAYDLRASTSPLSSATWNAATKLLTGAPLAPGSTETFTATGLAASTHYYFAVQVIDDKGYKSLLSNLAEIDTLDGTPPARIADLVAAPVDAASASPLSLALLDGTGSFSPETAADKLFDNDSTTAWITPGRTTATNEIARFDLGAATALGRLQLRGSAGYLDLFPVDFQLEVRPDATSAWTVVVKETGFKTAGAWEEWAIGRVMAKEARLVVTKTALWAGQTRAVVGDLALFTDDTSVSRIRLAWTATGDDGSKGTATSYDVRRASSPLDDGSFAAATPVPGMTAPKVAGSLERFEITGLPAETQLCFGVQAIDDVGLSSGVSNSACAKTPGLPPATVVDLHLESVTGTTATLVWTAPGDDGATGTASSYDLRMAPAGTHISTANWITVTAVAGVPVPKIAGSTERFTVSGLSGNTTYVFALRTTDKAAQTSGVSNNLAVTTGDNVAPSKITDLAAVTDLTQLGTLTVTFTATGDNGALGTAKSYDLRVSVNPIDDANFANAAIAGTPVPQAAGAKESIRVNGLGAETSYYLALRVTDAAGNVSATSNIATGTTRQEPPSVVTDLVAVGGSGAQPATLIVQWTAPGNDGAVGTASRYDLRWSANAITAGNFATASAVTGVPTPSPSGALQQATVTGLSPGQVVYVALVTYDSHNNASALSNVLKATVADQTPPARVTDLAVTTGSSAGTVSVTFTAPGDDGSVGTAKAYEVRWSTGALSDATFGTGTLVTAPMPAAGGSKQSFTISGLADETLVHVALRAQDDVNNWSLVSNDATGRTLDVPPGAVADLRKTTVTGTTLSLAFTAPGDDGTKGTATSYDLRFSTSVINAANFAAATPAATGAPHAAASAESAVISGLTPATTYYVAIRAIDDRGNVGALSNILTTTTADTAAPNTVSDLRVVTGGVAGSLSLTFTAPGDDGTKGTATSYEIRWSTGALSDANFATGTLASSPVPAAGGSTQTVTLTGLADEALLHVALRAQDDAGNWSLVSNDASARTVDVAPSPVSDLRKTAATGTTLTLAFTAPGDDGTKGTATTYDVRYATSAITAANFAAATATAVSSPRVAGSAETIVVAGLSPATSYYVALRAIDDRGNAGVISNVVQADTADTVAPNTVADLKVATGTAPGTVALTLTAPGDDGTKGTATSYEVRWSTGALNDANFASGTLATSPAPTAGGAAQTFTLAGLPDEALVHVALRAQDDAGNWSLVSNDATGRTPDVLPSAIADLRSTAKTGTTLTFAFTAPGDDGTKGTATSYEVRFSTTALTAANFAAGTAVAVPTPHAAGSAETFVVTGLAPAITYFVAARALDDRSNAGPLSNVVSVDTLDTLAPNAIADLAAATGTASGTLALTFTAPGDDGTKGTATSYQIRTSQSAITEANWAAATPVAAPPAPSASGTPQSLTVNALNGETVYYVAIKAVDDAGNIAVLSNVASARTPAVPPSAVTDLGGTASSGAVTLMWTAPGDDGNKGTATTYDLRYATSPISDATFAAATSISTGLPKLAGSAETASVSGLTESTKYYFALKAVDDVGAWSALSNVFVITTPDVTAPAAPSALTVTTPQSGGQLISLLAPEASSVLSPAWDVDHVLDADVTTSWSTAALGASPETVVVDLGSTQSIDRIKLLPDAFYPQLFPKAFSLDVSTDKTSWKTVASESAFATNNAAWLSWGFAASNARYVRVSITDGNDSYGKRYAILAEMQVLTAALTSGQATLSFIAPGDDGLIGTATSYQVFRSTAPFDASSLGTATQVPGTPTPLASGALQSMSVSGLPGETTLYWAVRAVDEANNLGALSTVVATKTNNVAPAAVADLAGTPGGMDNITLTFTAPGDDATVGTATTYELRYATFAVSSQTFALATSWSTMPTPTPAGSKQSVKVTGLTAGVTYRFALLARDEVGNTSYLSNVAVVATVPAPDTTPPSVISDLQVLTPTPAGTLLAATVSSFSSDQAPGFPASALVDARTDLFWSSAARNAAQGTEEWVRVTLSGANFIDHVRLWPADAQLNLFPSAFAVRVSPDGTTWTTVYTASAFHAQAGTPVDASFAALNARYVELRATTLSPGSNGLFYAAVAEMQIYTAAPAAKTAVVAFTAPSDSGTTGQSASYDLRVGACPFNGTSSSGVATTTPAAAGSPERFAIGPLASGNYCAAVRSRDDANNLSAFSNVVTFTVP